MMQTYDSVNLDAFVRLLERPDPADLPRRSHVQRYDGDPDRRVTRLPPILMAWIQRRHFEIDIEEPVVVTSERRTRSPSGSNRQLTHFRKRRM